MKMVKKTQLKLTLTKPKFYFNIKNIEKIGLNNEKVICIIFYHFLFKPYGCRPG